MSQMLHVQITSSKSHQIHIQTSFATVPSLKSTCSSDVSFTFYHLTNPHLMNIIILICCYCGYVVLFSVHCPPSFHEQVNASNVTSNSEFGRSISMDKNQVVVGGVGAVDVFEFDAFYRDWKSQSKLQPPDPSTLNNFGNITRIKDDIIVITGKSSSHVNSTTTVVVFVFRFNISMGQWDLEDTLVGDLSSNTSFGDSIAIEGNWIFVGSSESTVGEWI